MFGLSAQESRLVRAYLQGFTHVICQVCVVSLFMLWGMQAIAMAFGEVYDWGAILQHLILMLSFLVFYPGQRFWTYRMPGPDDEVLTIVGRPPARDLAED